MDHFTTITDSLAGVVRDGLGAANLTLRDASHATGIPLTTLHRRVKGHSAFTVAELGHIADLLQTTPSTLVARAEERAA
jgi:predicted transcriptional regulator